MKPIRLLTFDVTGTLLWVKHTVGQQYALVLQKFFDKKYDPCEMQKSFEKSYKSHLKLSPMFGQKDGLSSKQWWSSVFLEAVLNSSAKGLCKNSVLPMQCNSGARLWALSNTSENEAISLRKAVDDIYWNFMWEPRESAVEVLNEVNRLKNQLDLSVGVISNNDERIEHVLKSSGIPMHFDFIISSHNYNFEKPDPRIFHAAIEKAGIVQTKNLKPSEMLHVGDNYEKDYCGAIGAGCKALLIDPLGLQRDIVNPNHCISDLKEVLKHIA
ncbi:haloacid dehalogenase-like hydrolase domain-containing protein 3 [Ciona intestinalis]